MAIQNAVLLHLGILGDDSSTVFKFDLEKDSFALDFPGQVNWDKKISPVGAFSGSPTVFSASLSGSLVTITFLTAPSSASVTPIDFYILFPGE